MDEMTKMIGSMERAKTAYSIGNLVEAKHYARMSLEGLKSSTQHVFEYFDCVTLLQSIAATTGHLEDYQSYEPEIRCCTLQLFHDEFLSYYSIHQYDSSEFYANKNRFVEAKQLIEEANHSLTSQNGSDLLLQYYYLYYSAKLCYRMEEFLSCIDLCRKVNEIWLMLEGDRSFKTPFLEKLYRNQPSVDRMGILNLILLSSSYGKINHCEAGIEILQSLSTVEGLDYYTLASIRLNLAELYARAGNLSEAAGILPEYMNADYRNYPDLAACIDTIQFYIRFRITSPDASVRWLSERLDQYKQDETINRFTCHELVSQDTALTHRFNLAVALSADNNYKAALPLALGLGPKGYSLQMSLYSELGHWDKLQTVFYDVSSYYLNQINNIFLYYNEELVSRHLQSLEYHVLLCMGAFIHCHLKSSEYLLPAEDLYEIVLNTKGISLEGSYVLRNYSDPSLLKNRKLYKTSEIQAALDTDSIIFDFTLIRTLKSTYYGLFLVSSTKVQALLLGEAEYINQLLEKYQDYITSEATRCPAAATEEDRRTTLVKLRRLLVNPIKSHMTKYKKIIISPTEDFFHFPFELLPFAPDEAIGERFGIYYINVVRELLFLPSVASDKVTRKSLVIGNPAPTSLPSLPFAELEAEVAGSYLHSDVYTGSSASYEVFFKKTAEYDLLHIATHGIVQHNNPEVANNHIDRSQHPNVMSECGLLLSDDYLVTSEDISSLALGRVRLCVLSSCYSGIGALQGSEGIFGLRRSFFLAGCKTLIVSLWSVNDLSGMLFMNEFYNGFVERQLNSLDALSEAKHALRSRTLGEWREIISPIAANTTSPSVKSAFENLLLQNDSYVPFQHPYYWAGYVAVGFPVAY